MFALRFFALALASIAFAANTNPAISAIVDSLDESLHAIIPNIETLQASEKANNATIGQQMNNLVTAFNNAHNNLAGTAVSSGSTTVMPTNNQIEVTFSDIISQVASGLSGITTATVPGFPAMVATLDPVIAATVISFNTTLPNSVVLVHTMMLDAQQFLVKEGFTQTLTAIGF